MSEKKPRQHDEKLARQRVAESPLRHFMSINTFRGNDRSSQNSIPRPDNFVGGVKKSGDQIHSTGRDE
jgi:hypothetical protein